MHTALCWVSTIFIKGGARSCEHASVIITHTPGQVFQDVPVLIFLTSYKHVSVHPHQCDSVVSEMEAWLD